MPGGLLNISCGFLRVLFPPDLADFWCGRWRRLLVPVLGGSSAVGVDYVVRVLRLLLHVFDYFRLRLILSLCLSISFTASDVVYFLIDDMTNIWSTDVPVLAPAALHPHTLQSGLHRVEHQNISSMAS